MISRVDLGDSEGDIRFYLSNNLEDWTEVGMKDWVKFSDSDQRRLFWRVEVEASDNEWVSPFLDTLQIGYYVEFL